MLCNGVPAEFVIMLAWVGEPYSKEIVNKACVKDEVLAMFWEENVVM